MAAHLSAFVGHFIPFGHIIGPLVVWVWKKDELPLVNDQGKEALNFQIAMTIYFAIAGVLCFAFVGLLMLPVLWLFDVIVVVLATVRSNEGLPYRYPFTIRLVS